MIAPVVDPEFSAIIPPLSKEEYCGLEQDIRKRGCLDALKVWKETNILLDGHNRLKICDEHGISYNIEYQSFELRKDAREYVILNQLERRNLSLYDRIVLVEYLRDFFKTDAQERMLAGVANPNTILYQGMTNELLSKYSGSSNTTTAKVKHIHEYSDKELVENLVGQIRRNESTITRAYTAIRRDENKKNPPIAAPIPDGKYSVIVIDPPWPMAKIEREVAPEQAAFDYPTMTLEQIGLFGVPEFSDDDCHLFLWTTVKHLPASFDILAKWGFKYVFTMVWHKPGGFQPFNLPQYNCEFVVYGRKGSPEFVDLKAFPLCFNAPRREHSRKPDEFYELVKRVCAGKMIDVFSREKREGFDQYGNECEKF